MSITTTADVSLSDYAVTIPVDPEQFLTRIPGFLIEAELKRRKEVLAAASPAVGHTLEATATATKAEFPPGTTIPVDGEVDISTTTEVEVESNDNDTPELDCCIDDVDDMAEAFLNRDVNLFEMRFAQMAPAHLSDRMSIRLRR